MVPLERFCAICHQAEIPVIVDAAGEYDLRHFLSAGAHVAIASAHKNFGALTAGIVAGRQELIAAMLLQDRGIGRPMKVGKEGIAAVIAALDLWRNEDQAALHAEWTRRAHIAIQILEGTPGIAVSVDPDMVGSPLYRARVSLKNLEAAADLVERLAAATPSIRVWRLGLPQGYFELDPRCITDCETHMIAGTILRLVQNPRPL